MRRFALPWLGLLFSLSCRSSTEEAGSVEADSTQSRGEATVVLTQPFCDVCSPQDKQAIAARSPVTAKVLELIDGAKERLDIAQFTFSSRPIEEALLRAHERGVVVRLAMDSAQERNDGPARRLRDRGLDVRFVKGNPGKSHDGIMHAKFMIVDGTTLLSGSNNWSSTGTSINEENTLVLRLPASDPRMVAHGCQFEAIWAKNPAGAGACSNGSVAFSPSGAAQRLVRDTLRSAQHSVDVLMHHLTYTDHVKELAVLAERGVRVRVIVNAADRAEHSGGQWNRLLAAGGRIRYKQNNAAEYQLMHHKLAVIDDRVLLHGSGNWSGSGFFQNFEVYARYEDPRLVQPLRGLYHRLWSWSLDTESLDSGTLAFEQHQQRSPLFFGNLHSHIFLQDEHGKWLDDGKPERLDEQGEKLEFEVPRDAFSASKQAYEHARGALDFLMLTPHTADDREQDPAIEPNMNELGFDDMQRAAAAVTKESGGEFLALAGMEWSTNSTGNHVVVMGSSRLAKTERGRFDQLYADYLTEQAFAGERPLVAFAHPRTFADAGNDTLNGSWDQVFGVNLQDIPKNGERGQKFNDFGLDDYPPLSEVRDSWIAGQAMPDPAVVAETLGNLQRASAPYARLMDVLVSRGTEFGSDQPRNPSLSEDEEGNAVRRTKVHSDWDYYLTQGFMLAPAASHDNHFANWGRGHSSRTVISAEALDLPRLLTAIEQREVYASEDENLQLRVYAFDRVPMGSETVTLDGRVPVRVWLHDADETEGFTVTVYQGQVGAAEVQPVASLESVGGEWLSLQLDAEAKGRHFFYVEVHARGQDRMAWSAPVWVERW